jgi:hypothetical protein
MLCFLKYALYNREYACEVNTKSLVNIVAFSIKYLVYFFSVSMKSQLILFFVLFLSLVLSGCNFDEGFEDNQQMDGDDFNVIQDIWPQALDQIMHLSGNKPIDASSQTPDISNASSVAPSVAPSVAGSSSAPKGESYEYEDESTFDD